MNTSEEVADKSQMPSRRVIDGGDGYTAPTFSLGNRTRRFAWQIMWALLFRISPRPLFGWRRFLLRLWGARIGRHCNVYPDAQIWAPWLLDMDHTATIGGKAEIYNPGGLKVGHHAIISQGAYICGASHDVHHPDFPFRAAPIELESYAWVCARAIVLPGVTLHEGAVLGAGAVTHQSLKRWTIYAGNPARPIGARRHAP
jgi:putative colanic acid biosynthesis acetyltransferase WcaF